MDFLKAQAPRVHYAEIRPMRSKSVRSLTELQQKVAAPGGIIMDCSEAVTLLCHIGGLADPNGNNYDGAGYTGTLLTHLPHYSDASKARVGALCVFGAYPGVHVAMVHEPGPDPMLWTHGEESDPSLHRLSWMLPGFKPPHTFLSIAAL
jgi:hypothetical protein